MITLEARPPNIEGEGEVRIRELVRNALRMRPDRIIVGEVRGAETLDMLQAMNTGHEGSLTTIHANTPRDALARLETLVMTAGVELPHRAIREQIASAFDVLVQISRLVDGSRRLTHITEVSRMESDVITLQDIFIARPPDEESAAAAAAEGKQIGAPARVARVHRAQAGLPREDGRERRDPAAELLRRPERLRHELLGGELRRVRVRRRRLIQSLLVVAVAALLAPLAATASVSLRNVDASGYPTVRATVVAPVASDQPPTLTENGQKVLDLTAQNLASAKSVVIAIDRSRSMAGKKLDDAVAAARAFVKAKAPSDQIAVVVFGSKPVQLTDFSSSTIDADDALRTMGPDTKSGTALYDALSLSTRLLKEQEGRAGVVVLLTDGKDVSSTHSLDSAVASAGKVGALVYPIGIGASADTAGPLQQMAQRTGGTYHAVASTSSLKSVYASIRAELRRTWELQYVTSARPGDRLHLRVAIDPGGRRVCQRHRPRKSRARDQARQRAAGPVLLVARRAGARR